MPDRCDTTDLLIDQCAHCKHPDVPPPTVGGKWRRFRGRYPGKCVRCGEWFRADVEIGRLENGAGYVGPCCLEEG